MAGGTIVTLCATTFVAAIGVIMLAVGAYHAAIVEFALAGLNVSLFGFVRRLS